MEFKTQVFLPHEGDHFRTRLTHTIEVAQISRTLARNLGLNEDLTEAIALVHDLGHTPFGHAGEDVLADLLADHGGFNHNLQSLRVVELLEERYDDHPGLNLTYEVREGIVKHESKHKSIPAEFKPQERPTLEASLVDIADEIAYNAHDIDDGVRAGIISLADLRDLSIWSIDVPPLSQGLFDSVDSQRLSDQRRHTLVRWLVNVVASDVLAETDRQIAAQAITSVSALRASTERICRYSDGMQGHVSELKSLLKEKLYRHERLQRLAEWAREILETLYAKLNDYPDMMPPRYQEMLLTEQKERVIADYIAGMTDRFAVRLYERLP